MSGLTVQPMTRKEIVAAASVAPSGGDYVWDGIDEDDRPLTAAELRKGLAQAQRRRGRPVGSDKTQIALRVDTDTLVAFRATGAGWQTRMNLALGEWIRQHAKV